jgi:hypothetical protein
LITILSIPKTSMWHRTIINVNGAPASIPFSQSEESSTQQWDMENIVGVNHYHFVVLNS